jgi:hypothetical protein
MKYVIQIDESKMFYQEDGVLSSNFNDAKKLSFEEAEEININLQFKGIKNWIYSEGSFS